ncbi:ABC transporter permease [Phytoactinopolyspora mesophila]|uniref:ABC transporter permease n=1 Tax=Phytoactinopolyspora mesophila TaxID=2650750 RepID=A0A7K3M0V9_9ACTN|nr:ABC transporter permease [Phytoactinopolyspora mesophila]NDL56933.1 ABC transporter permease [Phytoactinopolyspora mesophila]
MSATTQDQETQAREAERPSWNRFFERFGSSGPLVGLLVLVVVLSFLSPAFLTVNNMVNVFQQISVLAILALGMTAVIITAGIDLSVGSIVGLSGVVAGWTFVEAGLPMPVAFLAGLAVGALAGFISGLMITVGKLPPFIATLAMLSMARGLALVISDGQPISGYPDWFRNITRYQLFGVLPLSVLLVVVLFLLGAAYLRYRPSGRALYAIGGNEEVARLSGLKVQREKLKVYTAAGALAGLGGLILLSRLDSAQPTAGAGLELDVIAAVVIGGASLAGGRGSVSGTLVGALIIGFLRNGLNLLDVSAFWQQVIIGAVIAIAVMTDTLRRRSKH